MVKTMETNCYYCKEKATRLAICNDWGNIPICDKVECLNKFKKEVEKIGTQYLIREIDRIEGSKIYVR